ncbi:hypothetical protein, partial [Ursidibacter arcticus]|uniref:hypothetical protein n=1 Tax=Ursidibacter arcticus TaxID=1524965 RepID=UPI0012FC3C3E
ITTGAGSDITAKENVKLYATNDITNAGNVTSNEGKVDVYSDQGKFTNTQTGNLNGDKGVEINAHQDIVNAGNVTSDNGPITVNSTNGNFTNEPTGNLKA